MSNFEIIKQDERFALYKDGILIATYTRKDSAIRRMRKIEQSLNQSQTEFLNHSEIQIPTYSESEIKDETPLNLSSRVVGNAIFILNKVNQLLSFIDGAKDIYLGVDDESALLLENEAQAHDTLTQRVQRGAACHGVARSPPPRLIGGDIPTQRFKRGT